MGDSSKPSDDAPWTDAEQSFFAGAPPEEPQPPGEVPRLDDLFPVLPPQRPRRAIFAWLRSPLAAAWRRTTLALGAASARARRQVSAAAAGFVAALSSWRVDRRVVVAVLGVVVAAGLSAGVVVSRGSPLTKAASDQAEAPASGPAVAEAAPIVTAAPQSRADVRSEPAGVSHRRPAAHRKPVPAPASPSASTSGSTAAKRPLMTAFTDRESYWAHERQSPSVHTSTPLFSR